MKCTPAFLLALVWTSFLIQNSNSTLAHAAISSPEQDSLLIAAKLHPIPDDEWAQVSGQNSSQVYSVVRGDTLYDISRRLFGDARYWPKIWALNNTNITNPHLIRPGKQVIFMSGSGTTLPTLAVQDKNGVSSDLYEQKPGKLVASNQSSGSQEWRALPPQSWERVRLANPSEVDAQGFDRRSKITRRAPDGFELEMLSASQPLTVSGEITHGRVAAKSFMLSDEVFINSLHSELQVGDTYAIVEEPTTVKVGGRTGYAYFIAGKVRITGVKDGLFMGRITASHGTIDRGYKVIPMPAKVPNLRPIAAQSTLEGQIKLDRRTSLYQTAQHKLVFINRGSEDGIEPGMIFRVFRTVDPYDDKIISESNIAPKADLQVTQVSERFSVAMVISSVEVIDDESRATLLTDVSDLTHDRKTRELRTDGTDGADEAHDLKRVENIDTSGNLGKGEEKDLRQLEDHDVSAPVPSDSEAADLPPLPPENPSEALPSDDPSFDDLSDVQLPNDDITTAPPETAPAVEPSDLEPGPPPPPAEEGSIEPPEAPPAPPSSAEPSDDLDSQLNELNSDLN